MRVLVTGAGGALGREVVRHLTAEGWVVRAHDRTLPVTSPAAEVMAGDLRDRDHVRGLMSGVDAVVHAAAIPSPVDFPDPEIFGNNVESAYHVLDLAGRAGVRVVNVSSTSAIGIAWSQRGLSPLVVPVRESHPYVGDDVYGLSKQIGEVVAGAASRRWGIPVVSLRFPFIGTGERLRGHLARIHADVAVDRAGLWAWVDTRDAARAVSAAVVASLDGHHIVNVTAPDTTALVPTAELVRRFHPDALIEVEPCGFATVFDTVRSRESLGFEAVYGWRV